MLYKLKCLEPPYNVLKKKIPIYHTGIERYRSKKELLLRFFSRYLFWISVKLRLWIKNRNVYSVMGMLPAVNKPDPNGWLSKL